MLEEILSHIGELDKEVINKAQAKLDSLTKPLGSLGKLEEIVKRVVGITGELYPKRDKKAVVIMCGDNGVVEQGVSSCPKSVTASVTRNFTKGITGINILAGHAGADIVVIDIGVDADIDCEGVINKKIRYGTANIINGPAMTREETIKAINVGIATVEELTSKGINFLGTGEMGIGNTTTSSAIASVLIGVPVEKMVGIGAGLSKEGILNKIRVIKEAIRVNEPNPEDPLDVLAKVGGLDIAGLVGCFIGAARYRVPIIMDGFISSVSALLAVRIEPKIKEYIFPSHGSAEPGSKMVLDAMGFEPLLNLDMRLGEGTGAAIAFHIVDCAFEAYEKMGTFDDARIEQYLPQE